VAQRAETVILSLPDGKVSEAVARELAAAKPRRVKTVIDTSTIGIKAAEAVASILAAAGIEFIDAPVSGGIAGADKATIAIMVACSRDAYERVKPLLGLMGKPFYVGPKPGRGRPSRCSTTSCPPRRWRQRARPSPSAPARAST
jgi:3-hydroxyisobutyrate dehydrogenase